MSGTSARESYRSGKRTRPSDSQACRMTPPVLFRLPSVAMPVPDAAMTMPVPDAANASSAAMAMSAPATAVPASQMSSTPSAPAQTAAASTAAEKASGQRLLNMIIVVLLLAALAVIAWISLNRQTVTSPAMADKKVGSDAGLETLGELKVPDVNSATLAEAAKPKTETTDSGPGADEIKPSQPSDLSLIDLPDAKLDGQSQPIDQGASGSKSEQLSSVTPDQAGSLLVGIDTTSTEALAASSTSSATSTSSSTPTAQIQLRTPVPMGNSQVGSLVDSQRSSTQLGNASSTSMPRVDTVSTPTQSGKVFPANTDPALNTNTSTNSSSSSSSPTNTGNSGGSPALWDGAQRPSLEGLQLSGKPTSNNPGTQVNISKPLSAEIAMPGTTQLNETAVAQQLPVDTSTNTPEPGVTVGGGATEPYSLHKSRLDLDPVMLAKYAAAGAGKSAVSSASIAAGATARQPINSYASATGTPAAGQNLYQNNANNYAKPSTGNAAGLINSYATQSTVPAGVTGNGQVPYMPATTTPPQNTGVQAQWASGPNSIPAAPASYTVPPRGQQPGFGQAAVNPNSGYGLPNTNYQQPGVQPTAGAQPVYAPSSYAQPNYAQPNYAQPNYAQPNAQPNYAQPNSQPMYGRTNYGQTPAPSGYGQPNTGYGPTSGSGYANPAYPPVGIPGNMNTQGMNTQGMNTQGMNIQGMPAQGPGNQSGASYPTRNPYPGGQVPTGLIGPAGNATAPSGDIAPVPVMGRGGVGTSAPYGSPQ